MNYTPRHHQIVEAILGAEYSLHFTFLIGLSEVVMAFWILSGYKSRINASIQIIIVLVMNILEFILVPELLLWGRMNTMFALLFICIVGYNEFVLNKSSINK